MTREGEVGAGDPIDPIERAEASLAVSDVVRLDAVDKDNQELLRGAAGSSILPESWRDDFRRRLREPDAGPGQVE